MSVNQGERKRELCWPQSPSTQSILPEVGETFSPALFSLSSPPTSGLSSMGPFDPSASLYITITTARTSPARPDGTQRRGTPQSPALPCCSMRLSVQLISHASLPRRPITCSPVTSVKTSTGMAPASAFSTSPRPEQARLSLAGTPHLIIH